MDNIKYGIIVCEKWYQIHEIAILNQNKVELKYKKLIFK